MSICQKFIITHLCCKFYARIFVKLKEIYYLCTAKNGKFTVLLIY